MIEEAVVLAGGVGSRLFPLTKFRPKPLVPIGNYTMLDWNFHVLASNGIKRVIVVVKYLGEQIKEHIENHTSKIHKNMEILVPDVDSKDTADAVRKVAHLIQHEHFFVTMADIVTNINLREMGQFHIEKKGIATISLKKIINQPHQFGVISLDSKSKIMHFIEKPRPQELYLTTMIFQKRESVQYHTNLVNSGIYAFKREILDILTDFQDLMDFGKNVFPFLLERNLGIFGYTSDKGDLDYFWADCGRPQQLLWTTTDVLGKWNWPYLPKGHEINGSWIGSNTNIHETAKINPPCAIDDNSQIDENASIFNSTIGKNCVIKKNTSISDSIIWDNTKIGEHVIINKSIIANDVIIEDNCTIEPDTIIGKGIRVKSNSIIKKGTVLEIN